MIASVHGRINDKENDSLVLEVGGVGLQVFVPAALRDTSRVGETLTLFTHLVVRETELTLYGFPSKEERRFFGLLLGVNGVGPRLALAALSTLNPNAIRRAVFNQQAEVFSQIPGVGKKTAQKILLHLGDKVTAAEGFEPATVLDEADGEVLAALTTLGYSVVEAQAAIQMIPKDAPEDLEERLRIALQYFGGPG